MKSQDHLYQTFRSDDYIINVKIAIHLKQFQSYFVQLPKFPHPPMFWIGENEISTTFKKYLNVADLTDVSKKARSLKGV